MEAEPYKPLADRMRPRCLEEVIGQEHVLAEGKPLYEAVSGRHLHSMVFWGPPGTGKTTLARLIARCADAEFIALSAVLSGIKDVRDAVASAKSALQDKKRQTILFVDEVHRFNKSQQDGFLPHIEDGTIHFIGATTENPSFALNNALLSRTRVYVLKTLNQEALGQLLNFALRDTERGIGLPETAMSFEAKKMVVDAADGDARKLLNLLELAADLAGSGNVLAKIPDETVRSVVSGGIRRFDRHGEDFYNQISALHKSVRGSAPDAALYWLCRMLDAGCDAAYLARRIVRIASEDIGNADPRALGLALNAWESLERLGSPEGDLGLAQAVVYLACAPKSNAVYKAYQAALRDARNRGSLEVPLHLRNAPTKLMEQLHYGREYRYAHDEPEGYVAAEEYFPGPLSGSRYYDPAPRGLEIKIAEKLKRLKELDQEARNSGKAG
ncbi:MAG: replication-associated recombination protein A [Methylococcales bacterium]